MTWLMAGARVKLIKKYQPVECLFTEEIGNVCVCYVYLDWSCVVPWADSAHKIHFSSLAGCILGVAGSAMSCTLQILAPLLPSAKLCKNHFD